MHMGRDAGSCEKDYEKVTSPLSFGEMQVGSCE
jgi:hypothetical protein